MACVAGALLWRAPWLVFTDLNWDESLYRLIADGLLHGHAPYVELWDRKPAGLFVLVAMVQAVLGTSALALHVAAAVAVGLGAWCLAGVTSVLLPRLALAGPLAAALWIVFVDRNGGMGTNAELFFVPLNLVGAWLMLRARGERGLFLAGLLFGVALQVKYNAFFTWPAFGVAWLLFSARPVTPIRAASVIGFGAVLPTLAVLAWYGLIGQFDAWVGANLAAQWQTLQTAVGSALPNVAALPELLKQYDVPVAGTLLALVWIAWRERGAFAYVLAAWLAADAAALWFLHRLADHMMIQILPALCVAAGFGLARTAEAAGRWRMAVLVAVALIWIGSSGRELARPFVAAVEVVARRQEGESAAWGDQTATAGALLAARLAPGETIYVFGGAILGVYEAAGRWPPTRFPFAEHLWGGYAPVDGVAELGRILAGRPAFIAVSGHWLAGGEVPNGAERVFAVLHGALARDYLVDATVGAFVSRGGGLIGRREPIVIFRRADRAS